MSKIEQVLGEYIKDNSIDLDGIISNLDKIKEGLKRNIKPSSSEVLGLQGLIEKTFSSLSKDKQTEIYKEVEKIFLEEDIEKIKSQKGIIEKIKQEKNNVIEKEIEKKEEADIEKEIIDDLSIENKENTKEDFENTKETEEKESMDIDFGVDLDLSLEDDNKEESNKEDNNIKDTKEEEKIIEEKTEEILENIIEQDIEEPLNENKEKSSLENSIGKEEENFNKIERQEEKQEQDLNIEEEIKEGKVEVINTENIDTEMNAETIKNGAYNDFGSQNDIAQPKIENKSNNEEKHINKSNKKSIKETILEIYQENKKNIIIIGGAILLLGLVSIIMTFVQGKEDDVKPIETKVEVSKTNTGSKEEKENNDINKNKETTNIVKIEDNKIKIQNVIKGLKNTYDGFKIEEIKNGDNIFLGSKVYFYNLAKTNKTKGVLKKTLDPIYKVDKEMGKIKVVWLKVSPTINDNILKTTCEAYFQDKLDCDNLVVLRKQDKLKEISAKVIKQKVGYFLEVGIPLFIDDNYNLLKNENEDLLYVNDFLIKKMSPIFDKMSEKEVGLLKAYLDDKDGILNTRFRIISNDKVRSKMLNSIKSIYVKASKIKNKDLSEKEAVLWMKYYYYLVYKLFNN